MIRRIEMSFEVEQRDKEFADDLTSHVGTNHVSLHPLPSGRRFQYGEWSRQCGGFGTFSFYRSWGSYRTRARRNDDGDFAPITGMMILSNVSKGSRAPRQLRGIDRVALRLSRCL